MIYCCCFLFCLLQDQLLLPGNLCISADDDPVSGFQSGRDFILSVILPPHGDVHPTRPLAVYES